MEEFKKTIFYNRHVALEANMVEFSDWDMPLHYKDGIMEEHLLTRKKCGLFDVSHMGRFMFKGEGVLKFLQYALSNNAAMLEPGQSQYTIIPDEKGGAIDDAYLYYFTQGKYLLVVNASNKDKDWTHFQKILKSTDKDFREVEVIDSSEDLAMLSLQGPLSKGILEKIIDSGSLPEPVRNSLSLVTVKGKEVSIAATGYTGEPLCFELFVKSRDALMIWDLLIDQGAFPVGLGARDTLRLEAGLPLYGHEFGLDPANKQIPVFACALAGFAVSFSHLKGDFIGRQALLKQFEALKKIKKQDYSSINALPRWIKPIALIDKGIARPGAEIFFKQKQVGFVTSGTMVPFWEFEGYGLASTITDQKGRRPVCLGLVDSDLKEDDNIDIEIRGRRVKGVIVSCHLRSEAPPYARPILLDHIAEKSKLSSEKTVVNKVRNIFNRTIENTRWRQTECINLIPSEQTLSPMARLVSIMDPAFRYAEHKRVKAFYDADIFYYQGTGFIEEVEKLLEKELCLFLGCREVETRLISGQMANTAVFSAMVDYLNRLNRKVEPGRISCVLNNHIMKGGHLSAQPMGALRDYLSRDPKTEKPAVVNFPVFKEDPYKIDISQCKKLMVRYKPELIIMGKSMVLYPEPIEQIKALVKELSLKTVIMYDMAHVLGLVGPYFQEPFKEGADLVTASTHKTFFGTQRGIVASNYKEDDQDYPLWETIIKRTFPGSVSNHHLGTMLGLLISAYEMNHFKDEYQKKVLANAKAFALALKHAGLKIAGNPEVSYTQTHQVIVNVGYAQGAEAADRLEHNNIIVNYQATPEEEGFTAAGSLRLGVAEMTRFGLEEEDFKDLAQLIHDVVIEKKTVKDEIKNFRKKFLELKFCFSGKEFDQVMEKLHRLI